MFVIINALKSISRSKGRNILIGIIVLVIAASSCVALAIRNAAGEAEIEAMAIAETEEEQAKAKADEAKAEAEKSKAEAQDSVAAMKEMYNITGSLSLDRMKMMEKAQEDAGSGGRVDMREIMMEYQDLTLSELQTYADSDYVKDFYYYGSISLNATGDLEAYSTESSDDTDASYGQPGGGFMIQDSGRSGDVGGRMIGGMMMSMGDFTATGYNSEESMTKFVNGTATLKEGKMFDTSSSDLECIISYELALFNSLSVGDEIVLSNPNSDDETYTFTIVGIYNDTSSAETNGMPRFSTAQDPANLVCISYKALQSIIENSEANATTGTNNMGFETTTALTEQISHTYVFSNLDNFEKFQTELTEKGLSEYYTLTSSDLSEYTDRIGEADNTLEQIDNTLSNYIENTLSNYYEESLAPLQNLSNFATTLFFIILIVGAVILIVINVFNIRERKYEVGVLTAIGIKKGKVAMQFVTELLCVTLVAIIIGTGIGAAVSVPVANSLLSDQIEQSQSVAVTPVEEVDEEPQNNNQGGFFIQGMPQFSSNDSSMLETFSLGDDKEVNYWDKINAAFNFTILAQLLGLGIILTFVSSLAAIVFVMRYEPLKILANRA